MPIIGQQALNRSTCVSSACVCALPAKRSRTLYAKGRATRCPKESTPTTTTAKPARMSRTSSRLPYWKRAHKDWKFWVGVLFIAAAIIIYVLSLDLSTVPHPHT